MPVTLPDNIYFSDTSAPADVNAISSSEATSVQAALALRQRFDFSWANAAARTGQVGMVTGSTGYQIDTKSEYIYESGSWRLKLSYAEYTAATQTIPNATSTNLTALTLSASTSTDATFTSISAGALTIVNPGVYSFSVIGGVPGGNFLAISSDAAHTAILCIGPFTAGVGQTTLPFYRTATANTVLYPYVYQSSGTSQNLTNVALRVGRLG